MTVAELIEVLKEKNQDSEIYVKDEDGDYKCPCVYWEDEDTYTIED